MGGLLDNHQVSELKAVCVGGGLGAPLIMRGLRRHTSQITGLIAVTDSGRSTGKIRIALNVPAPGDIRNALTVLAEGDDTLVRLMNQRFATDRSEELNGMAFGNLFLAALTQQEGSFLRAVEEASRMLQLRGRVLPVTLYNTHLCAELEDGRTVVGEVNVRGTNKAAIRRLHLSDPDVEPVDGALEAIGSADLIVLGPGSLFTTVCACLLTKGLADAISRSDALVVYVANTTRHPGQTDTLSLADHVAQVVHYLGGAGLDIALINDEAPPPELVEHYARQGLAYLEPSEAELARIRGLAVEPVLAPLIDTSSGPRDLWQKLDTIRHDPARTADALVRIYSERRAAVR
jgi:uncharacterized cofD-like protein